MDEYKMYAGVELIFIMEFFSPLWNIPKAILPLTSSLESYIFRIHQEKVLLAELVVMGIMCTSLCAKCVGGQCCKANLHLRHLGRRGGKKIL